MANCKSRPAKLSFFFIGSLRRTCTLFFVRLEQRTNVVVIEEFMSAWKRESHSLIRATFGCFLTAVASDSAASGRTAIVCLDSLWMKVETSNVYFLLVHMYQNALHKIPAG